MRHIFSGFKTKKREGAGRPDKGWLSNVVAVELETENAGVAIDLAIVLRDRSFSRVWDGRKGSVYIRGQRGTLRDQQ